MKTTKKSEWIKTRHNYLYKRLSGKYYARISVDGKQTFKDLKTDQLEIAKSKLRELIKRVETGQKIASQRDHGRTLGALVDEMIERTNNSLHLKPNSIAFEKRCLGYIKKHWPQDAHKQKLKDISKKSHTGF